MTNVSLVAWLPMPTSRGFSTSKPNVSSTVGVGRLERLSQLRATRSSAMAAAQLTRLAMRIWTSPLSGTHGATNLSNNATVQ